MGMRFSLTFGQNTHRIKVFRLAKRTNSQGSKFLDLADGGDESGRARNESKLLTV
jgi:hypothetical protein